MLAVLIIVMVAMVVIMIVVANIETCPYCGSMHLEKRKIDPNLNPAGWSVRCKKCGKEFYMG